MPEGISVVVPTVGRPSLADLLDRLRPQLDNAPVPVELILVDDAERRGPAATRNRGWRTARHPWVAFLDDDVLPAPNWLDRLVADLDQPPDVGGVQGRVTVPRPAGPADGDWAANTAGLEEAVWATADMAYRRAALASVGGFDERFPRAYREDADLAYRIRYRGWRLVVGQRRVSHPVRPESPWISLRTQRGNADDALLRRLYGAHWHRMLAAPVGRRRRHAGIVAAGLAALALAAVPVRRARRAGLVAGLGWLAGTTEFVVARLRAATEARRQLGPLLVTSVLIPPVAVGHWLDGWVRSRHARPWFGPPSEGVPADRDPETAPWAAQPTVRSTSAASSADTVADQPLSSLESGRPARSSAWSTLSTVSTPWATGVDSSSATRVSPSVTDRQT